jgi:hypothetical protein
MSHSIDQPKFFQCYLGTYDIYRKYRDDIIKRIPEPHFIRIENKSESDPQLRQVLKERVSETAFVKIETKSEPEPKLDFGSKQRLRGRNKRQKRKQLYQSK